MCILNNLLFKCTAFMQIFTKIMMIGLVSSIKRGVCTIFSYFPGIFIISFLLLCDVSFRRCYGLHIKMLYKMK